MVVLACDLSTWEAEAGGAWSVTRLGNKQAEQLSWDLQKLGRQDGQFRKEDKER